MIGVGSMSKDKLWNSDRANKAREELEEVAGRPTPGSADEIRQWSAEIREKQDAYREVLESVEPKQPK